MKGKESLGPAAGGTFADDQLKWGLCLAWLTATGFLNAIKEKCDGQITDLLFIGAMVVNEGIENASSLISSKPITAELLYSFSWAFCKNEFKVEVFNR
ncbi:hypothetical protein KDW_61760 [Dictyobacter vulcani]|uniref:Uncharacterized protein n=1 Tax=Dictyobacter vulcani TaxID=2607529 RepID=A0A5J4KRK5_9CHLR|nr:hypothetical protein [Dictyobacter vulcani]GER92014.1 hypothetical protein KDW_61760 [Dictyobacter vulcani]